MKTNNLLRRTVAMAAVFALGFAFSCQETESPYATEASYVAEESVTDYYYEDADDMAGMAVAAEDGTGGKLSSAQEGGILSVNDDRFNVCALVEIVFDQDSNLDHPLGTLSIDFGTGCTDPRGNTRSGKVIVRVDGRRFQPGSKLVITFQDYVINGIKLNGTRTLTNITGSNEEAPKFQIELENGSVEWPDGTTASREHCYQREWIRMPNPINDEWHVSQCDQPYAASGVNRRGREYTMEIETTLVYKRGCPIAVQGKKVFDVEGTIIEVDYGTGDCDRAIIITIDGSSRSMQVRKRG